MSEHEIHDTIRTRTLCLVGPNGIELARLSAEEGGPTIEMLDSEGRIRVELALERSGRIYLGIFGEDGAPRVDIDVSTAGSPSFYMYDNNGDIIWGKP